jgi:hypothetical protein
MKARLEKQPNLLCPDFSPAYAAIKGRAVEQRAAQPGRSDRRRPSRSPHLLATWNGAAPRSVSSLDRSCRHPRALLLVSDLDTTGKHGDELVTWIARDALKALAANTRASTLPMRK